MRPASASHGASSAGDESPPPPHTEFFVSGGGGYDLHPELKPEADGTLNDPAQKEFFASTHGFMSVAVSAEALTVEFYDDKANQIYRTEIRGP